MCRYVVRGPSVSVVDEMIPSECVRIRVCNSRKGVETAVAGMCIARCLPQNLAASYLTNHVVNRRRGYIDPHSALIDLTWYVLCFLFTG